MKIFTSEVPIILENGLIFTNSFAASAYPEELEEWLATWYKYVYRGNWKYIQPKDLQSVLDKKALILWDADKPVNPFYAFYHMLTVNQNIISGSDVDQNSTLYDIDTGMIYKFKNNIEQFNKLFELFFNKVEAKYDEWANAEENL